MRAIGSVYTLSFRLVASLSLSLDILEMNMSARARSYLCAALVDIYDEKETDISEERIKLKLTASY